MSWIGVITASSTVLAALVTGYFTFLAKRASSRSPETVAGGYSKLVSDMRGQHDALMARVAELEAQRWRDHRQMQMLSQQVGWLLEHISSEAKAEFDERFAIQPASDR